jgi:HrpA-like RNA helicase
MIVFTTNVAETSITVPGVKLVVDSGFAKEAEYDPIRMLTVVSL